MPYAEVNLDGNVHFIGTQGVGKSTLLRSILFFYNADKSRLGIRTQDKQQGYDEFYLPYSNSYIIYEVVRENGNFFVATFRSQGRVAFRIVDCEYNRLYFIDESGMARDEWGKISETIGAEVFKSRIIRHYEEFRDIIYGNRQNLSDPNLRRFCIMESDRYQNIVRAITNIFLNQSLESRVIKDTIIDSLDFSNDNVDLAAQREQINKFRNRYEDIWKWYKREKNGTVKVRLEADKVISELLKYDALCREIDELYGLLVHALKRDEQSLPEMVEHENVQNDELSRQKRLLSEEAAKYDAENNRHNQTEGSLKDFLKRLEEKSNYYRHIGIEDIVNRVNREEEFHIGKKGVKKRLDLLTGKSLDIKQRYDAIFITIDSNLKEALNEIDRRLNESTQKLSDEKSNANDSHNDVVEHIRNRYVTKLNDIKNEMRLAENERNELKLQEVKTLNSNPFEKEMLECDGKIAELNKQEKDLENELVNTRSEIDSLTHKAEIKETNLTAECDKEIAEIENQISTLNIELENTRNLLNHYSGSLMEWLSENKAGWEDNIGVILDEKAVLYNTGLNPRKVDDSSLIMGIHIDVGNIEREVRSPRDLQQQVKSLEERISQHHQSILARKEKLKVDIEEALSVFKKRIKSLREKELDLKSKINPIPLRIGRLKDERTELNGRLHTWRNDRQNEILANRVQVEKRIEGISSREKAANDQFNKEKKACDDRFRKLKNEIVQKIKLQQSAATNEKEQREQDAAMERLETTARMDAEMKGAGIDTSQLEGLRRQLQIITDELSFINRHKQDYFGWLNDKKEYFDVEDEKRLQLKELRKKMADLQAKFKARKQRFESEIHRLDSGLKNARDIRIKLEETIRKVHDFLVSDSRSKDINAINPIDTAKGLAEIFEKLRDNLMNYQRHEEEFRKSVNDFKSNFSTSNTLGFDLNISSINDYKTFAHNIREFIVNNKIEIVRIRTNEMYADVIQRISRDVSDLLEHGADIRKTITDINRDFRENNFAGVIKEIELRAVESNDRIMQQLLHIKEFVDNNSHELGELNLFSEVDKRDKANDRAARLLMTLGDLLDAEHKREKVTLADTFKLEFKVKQNDQDTNWVEKLSNVGSDGTDILVKAIVNIMLINVFKRKASTRFGDFTLHCMMDEIGKLHPNNVQGILAFANARNIRLINSSPTTYNASAYRYTYALSKDSNSNTVVKSLLTIR